jgi:Raf kinase inhibitor-like YbhB/YbcL family protein
MSSGSLERARRALFAGAMLTAIVLASAQAQTASNNAEASTASFTVTSPDIANGKKIPDTAVFNSFGCNGKNVSPALSWSNAPAGTMSFALMVHDPDAPTGSGWWHWIAYNIPADVTSLPADAGDPKKNLMPGTVVQSRTDFGAPGYGGPCPPPGKQHHYHFRLYALKVPKLDVPADATAALVGFAVNANSLGMAQIVALYGR